MKKWIIGRFMKKKKYVYVWIVSITLSIIGIIITRNINTPLYDTTIVEKKLYELLDEYGGEEGLDQYLCKEIDGNEDLKYKEAPSDKRDSIIFDTTFKKCEKKYPDSVKVFKAAHNGALLYADSDGSFDSFFHKFNLDEDDYSKEYCDDGFLDNGEDVKNSSKKDVELVSESDSMIVYRQDILGHKDIEKKYPTTSMDQRVMIAYNTGEMKYYLSISGYSVDFKRFDDGILANEDNIPTTDEVLNEFQKLMDNLSTEYVVKKVKTTEERSMQYLCFQSGNEIVNRYNIVFNTFVDGCEVLSVNDSTLGDIDIHSEKNTDSCEMRGIYNCFFSLEPMMPEKELLVIDNLKSIEEIYDTFEKYIEKHDTDNIKKEVHVDDIGVKYVLFNKVLWPLYVVSTTEDKYYYENGKWDREKVEYLFAIDGVEYEGVNRY